jgi:hypothetical protein
MNESKSKPSVFKDHLSNHELNRATNNLTFLQGMIGTGEDLCPMIFVTLKV